MKLIQLTCDHRSFRPLRFRPQGITLVVGDSSRDNRHEGSSNGVGKTLALGLVHHCLGSEVDPQLKQAVPEWVFRLRFSVGDKEHQVERSGDGRILSLDEQEISTKGLRIWLNESGVFRIDPSVSGLTFRSLFSRFARHHREDCNDPIGTKKEQEVDARLRSLYLLGLDYTLAMNKAKQKEDLDRIKGVQKIWKNDSFLKELFRSGAKPRVRIEWLDKEIRRQKEDLDRFHVAENYHEIEAYANELTQNMREYERQIAILKFQLDGIDKALTHPADISREDLVGLYNGLEQIFRPETLRHLQAVEDFHHKLTVNRTVRLQKDKLQLTQDVTNVEKLRAAAASTRDEQLRFLHGKRALDEYASIAKHIAAMEEEHTQLLRFVSKSDELQKETQQIKEKMIHEDGLASQYLDSNPAAFVSQRFSALAGLLYPNLPAGIVIENNVRDNKVRYNISVQIEGDASDGINAARILCFDWVLFNHGENHRMGFLWHDNRLFADMDPRPRAAWFSHALRAITHTGKQYIATLNTENFDAMLAHLDPKDQESIRDAVVLELFGDKPENKLLGIQFGGSLPV